MRKNNTILKEIEASERIAEIASVFSDPTRVKIVTLLMQETSGASTMDICTRLGLYQPRISSHLAILLRYGIVSVANRGRQRIYTLPSDKVTSLLKDLSAFHSSDINTTRMKPCTSSSAMKEVRANSEIRQCRTCYDHLAGVAGVELLEQMLRLRWLFENAEKDRGKPSKILYELTQSGSKSLEKRGVDIQDALKSNRTFAYACMDWTERQPHLGGSLGNAILNSFLSNGFAERKKGTRALKLVKPISFWMKV